MARKTPSGVTVTSVSVLTSTPVKLTERILFSPVPNHKIGGVHDGAATMDWMERKQGVVLPLPPLQPTFWSGMGASSSQSIVSIH